MNMNVRPPDPRMQGFGGVTTQPSGWRRFLPFVSVAGRYTPWLIVGVLALHVASPAHSPLTIAGDAIGAFISAELGGKVDAEKDFTEILGDAHGRPTVRANTQTALNQAQIEARQQALQGQIVGSTFADLGCLLGMAFEHAGARKLCGIGDVLRDSISRSQADVLNPGGGVTSVYGRQPSQPVQSGITQVDLDRIHRYENWLSEKAVKQARADLPDGPFALRLYLDRLERLAGEKHTY